MNKINEHWLDCESPILVKNRYTGDLITTGCGKCHACQVRKIMHNVPSLVRESYSHKYSMFVTLTYNDKNLPHIYLPDYENNLKQNYPNYCKQYFNLKNQSSDFISLYKGNIPVCKTKDLQDFIKRLRMSVSRSFPGRNIQIRYAFSWDYGSTLFRPHYHGLIWFDSPELHQCIAEFISKAWQLYDRSSRRFSPIGRIDCQDSYSASKYVAAYINSIEHLPAIYTTKDFRVRMVHSSNPPLGSLLRTLETPAEIVNKGLTKVSLYNPLTYEYDLQPLTPSLVRRYFPTITSFNRLTREERVRLYRIGQNAPHDRTERIKYFNRQYDVNSFFKDFVSLGFRLDQTQKNLKFDTFYYTVQRLIHQSSLYGYSLVEYDNLIESYYYHRFKESITKQFRYEQRFANSGFSKAEVDYLIDIATLDNDRGLSQYLTTKSKFVSPHRCESEFFNRSKIKFNKLIKRKCDNSYLEKHPQFKQFHS